MTFEKSWGEALKKYKTISGLLPDHCLVKFVRSQALFEYLLSAQSSNPLKQPNINKKPNLLFFFKNLGMSLGWMLLALFTIFNVLCIRYKGLKIAHYQIDIKNSVTGLDFRSAWIRKELPESCTINFFHTVNPLQSLAKLFRKKNAIYFESLVYLIICFKFFCIRRSRYSYLFKSLDEPGVRNFCCDQEIVARASVAVNRFLLKVLGVEKFLFLDDSRHIGALLYASKMSNIKTLGYMHGRFNEFHVGLFSEPFDQYLVWSEYFAKKLLNIDSGYCKSKVCIIGNPYLHNVEKIIDHSKGFIKPYRYGDLSTKLINVLWIGESHLADITLDFLKVLGEDSRFVIYFRPKVYDAGLKRLMLKHQYLKLDQSTSIFRSFSINSIDVVVGTRSTALIESWLHGIPSVALLSNNDYGRHLWDDGISILCTRPQDLTRLLKSEVLAAEIKSEEQVMKFWAPNRGRYNEEVVRGLLLEFCRN